MRRSTQLTAGYVGLAALDTWLAGRPGRSARAARFVTKPALMPVLASARLAAGREHPATAPLRTTTLVAQAFSWGGDVALLGRSETMFRAGVASFALAHASYVAGFWRQRTSAPVGEDRRVRAIGAVTVASAPVMAVAAARREPRLGVPVAGYSLMLGTMAASAQQLGPQIPAGARRLTAAGALLFMTSDTLLGVRKFVLSDPPHALESAVMATYTAAQLLLSEGSKG